MEIQRNAWIPFSSCLTAWVELCHLLTYTRTQPVGITDSYVFRLTLEVAQAPLLGPGTLDSA